MTKSELSQLYYLNREIEREKRRYKTIESADCKATIAAKIALSVVEYNRLNRYIESVDDSMTRQILSLRFVSGLSWRQVALHIGGGNTAEGVRMICKRFLEKN